MFVLPCRPQAPLTGLKTSGLFPTNSSCSSGFSFTTAQFESGYPFVAKILPATRKSGWRMCADSIASGKLSASLRKSSGVIDPPPYHAATLFDPASPVFGKEKAGSRTIRQQSTFQSLATREAALANVSLRFE